jgi:hypothetical protein
VGLHRVAGSLCDFLAELNYKNILAEREQKLSSKPPWDRTSRRILGWRRCARVAFVVARCAMRVRRGRQRWWWVVVLQNDTVVVVAVVVIVIDVIPSGRGQRGQPRTAVKSMPLAIPPEEVGHGRRCHARAIRGTGRIGRRERRGRVVRQGQGGGGVGQEDGDRGGRRRRRRGAGGVRGLASRALVLAGASSAA